MKKLTTLTLGTLAMCAASASYGQGRFDDVQIRSQEIAPGISVLFGAGGNMAVSHGEDATILIDDQFAPLSAKIEAAVADLGASPVKYVVNTHWHGDHTGGNEHFGKTGATIFAHTNVRVRLATPQQRGERVIGPSPDEALPVVTYDQGLKIHLNGDTIRLMFPGGGHTDGDSVVFWEEDNIVHMGDLYFNIPGFPFIDTASGGNVYDAMRSLDLVISTINSDTQVIPGHGEMSTKAELIAYRAMMGEAVERVDALRGEGKTLEEALAAKPLEGIDRGEGGFISADAFVTAIWNSAS